MPTYPYVLETQDQRPVQLGLVALETDETIERDLRRLLPLDADLLVSRIPFPRYVSPETLQSMAPHLTASCRLLPPAARLASVGYGCTSGAAQIGPAEIAERVRAGCTAAAVTEPVSALTAASRALGVTRLAFLSPYVESVSARLRDVLAANGIACPVFGSFDEPEDHRVARITPASIRAAAESLAGGTETDAVFMSCTSLQTLDIIAPLDQEPSAVVESAEDVADHHVFVVIGQDGLAGT